ncbi:hypothetical protein AC028_03920 [Xanthomonas citri pv. aurantifolii]|uniref:Uncharacterized protein n=1 Tax=Xanthomonas citri pv. sesbaniae TaxID=473425 RepID=A0AAW4RUG3_XANCI|nr:hypothetical protein AC028_03920 [Xanthomonas citri pv. aurantifolii]KKY03986.1 hypothetical protein NY96_25785 [Xanthomonas citri pv. fuscans]MBZ3921862.1 hypothetical protein [Xanthomonas campestris pv. trichodesmae]MBZ3926526.1 hypothetical protein [Xanthomonas citri pv. sesbaniae]MBZ3927578.1 hypothetical protein [Xanthomonas citri pv. thirumalacharii]
MACARPRSFLLHARCLCLSECSHAILSGNPLAQCRVITGLAALLSGIALFYRAIVLLVEEKVPRGGG